MLSIVFLKLVVVVLSYFQERGFQDEVVYLILKLVVDATYTAVALLYCMQSFDTFTHLYELQHS